MPWPGVADLSTAEDEEGANSEPSVSITEPSEVNVARPGISAAAVVGVVGVKVNCHDPVKDGVAADMG
jgi:hypothetical protein